MGARSAHLSGADDGGLPKSLHDHGPEASSVKSNMIASIEQHVDWIADCLQHLGARKIRHIEADEGAESDWVDHVNQVADATSIRRPTPEPTAPT